MHGPIYVLGGSQSDFARNWTREGCSLEQGLSESVLAGLASSDLDPGDIEVGHVGNFVSDLFTGQAHLGGFFGHIHPDLTYVPASRHEAACASGSMALLAAMADLESGRYELACVAGIELMRNVSGIDAANNLRAAAWIDKEWSDTSLVWPCAFSELVETYSDRYGIDRRHLAAVSQKNFAQGAKNPNAQSRAWHFSEASFAANDDTNQTISGHIRKSDCGQITDGAAVVFLATRARAEAYAQKRGISLESLPTIKGWGHINAPMLLADKLRLSKDQPYIFPHVHTLFNQTLARTGLTGINDIDGLEVHDCFSITEYMILDHIGIEPPGDVWKSIEAEVFSDGGKLPVNMSGGLIGQGHPVGATGVRMMLDAFRQVTDSAGDCQIADAKNMMTFNLGGSATTCASFIIGI